MQTSVIENYPAGVPHEVHPGAVPLAGTTCSRIPSSATQTGRFRSAWNDGCPIGSSTSSPWRLGAWLQSRGLEPGARVAIMLPNMPQFAVTMAAVLRAGYTCVNVNPLYTARELEHQLKDSGATAIVILENFAQTLEQVIERTPVQACGGHGRWATCWAASMATGSPSQCATWRRWFRRTSCRWTSGAR